MTAVRGVRSWLATGDWGQYRKHPWWAALLFGPAVAAVAVLIAGAAWRTLIVPGPDGATVIPVQHASSSRPRPCPRTGPPPPGRPRPPGRPPPGSRRARPKSFLETRARHRPRRGRRVRTGRRRRARSRRCRPRRPPSRRVRRRRPPSRRVRRRRPRSRRPRNRPARARARRRPGRRGSPRRPGPPRVATGYAGIRTRGRAHNGTATGDSGLVPRVLPPAVVPMQYVRSGDRRSLSEGGRNTSGPRRSASGSAWTSSSACSPMRRPTCSPASPPS